MSNTELDVRYVARLARIELTDAEVETYTGQLSRILQYVDQLKELNVDAVEPTAHANAIFNVFRKDEAGSSFSNPEALANAPRSANSLILVPKVVE